MSPTVRKMKSVIFCIGARSRSTRDFTAHKDILMAVLQRIVANCRLVAPAEQTRSMKRHCGRGVRTQSERNGVLVLDLVSRRIELSMLPAPLRGGVGGGVRAVSPNYRRLGSCRCAFSASIAQRHPGVAGEIGFVRAMTNCDVDQDQGLHTIM